MFYSHLPFYLSIGITYTQYWDEDCQLVRYYRKAFQLSQQRRNQELWLQGAYFYEALVDVAPVLHAFAKKGTKPSPYVSEPFAISNAEVLERRQRDAQVRYDTQKAKVAAWAAKTNTKMVTGEVKQDG